MFQKPRPTSFMYRCADVSIMCSSEGDDETNTTGARQLYGCGFTNEKSSVSGRLTIGKAVDPQEPVSQQPTCLWISDEQGLSLMHKRTALPKKGRAVLLFSQISLTDYALPSGMPKGVAVRPPSSATSAPGRLMGPNAFSYFTILS